MDFNIFFVSLLLLQGITFEQFKDFFQFVNNLDDFEIVLRMYSFADQPMSEGM